VTKTREQLIAEEFIVTGKAAKPRELGIADIKFGKGEADFQQAEWLSYHLRSEWRYDHGHERWHHFDGTRWAVDAQDDVLKTVADTAIDAVKETEYDSQKKSLLRLMSVGIARKALEALRSFPEYKTDGSDWDQDPNLLGVANGVVDLTKGTLRDGLPEDLVTRNTGVAFDPSASCPSVLRFLREVFSDREGKPQEELVEYVLQVLGAALFGHSKPQQFYVSVGPGGAGKGTLYRLVSHVLGGVEQYASEPAANLYTKGRFGTVSSDRPRADLIELQGRRFAHISEPEAPFDDLLLLRHSGEDRITARPLHSNNVVSFVPTHTIMFSTNNPPPIKEVGVNMRRRLRVIPFVRTFGEKPDANLQDKLNAEASGFLNYLVMFAKRYHDDPSVLDLDRAPQVVRDASDAYLRANDPLAGYMQDIVILQPDLKAEAGALYDAYRAWFDRSGLEGEPLSTVKFSEQLVTTYNLRKDRVGASRRLHYFGIGLQFAPAALDEDES
jgi:putative DNA primase/helicase